MEHLIVGALKKRPLSARRIAKRIRRRVVDVNAACAALAERGSIERQGDAWALAPTARCTGTNAEGQACGNLSVVGSDRCAMHQVSKADARRDADDLIRFALMATRAHEPALFDALVDRAIESDAKHAVLAITTWLNSADEGSIDVSGEPHDDKVLKFARLLSSPEGYFDAEVAEITLRHALAIDGLRVVDRGTAYLKARLEERS
jgi:hypothetical protein